MLRRSLRRFERSMSTAMPIYNVLMSVQPEGLLGTWAREMVVLRDANVDTAGAWRDLPQHRKDELALPQELKDKLTKACSEGLATGATGTGKKIAILFGSQTGTSEAYAKMLGSYAVTHGFVPTVCSMNDGIQIVTDSTNPPAAVIFVCSTYGVGEFPPNAQLFWSKLSSGQLNQMRRIPHTILGLGNSHNENFNAAAKSLSTKLKQLGSKSFLRMQLSCELSGGGHDGVFRAWKRNIWPALGATDAAKKGSTNVYAVNQTYGKPHTDDHVTLNRHVLRARVRNNVLLTEKHYEPHTRLLTLVMKQDDQRELLGGRLHGREAVLTDHIEIIPFNPPELVERAIKCFGIDPEHFFEIAPLPGAPKSYFDGHIVTGLTLLRDIVDLSAMPSRAMLEALAGCARNEEDALRLLNLADDLTRGSEYDRLTAGVFSVMDLLEMFPSVKLTLSELMTYCPHIQPRTYSIANDNTESLHEDLQILYTVPKRTVEGRTHVGLCSGMMDRLVPGDHVYMKFTPSTIPLPHDDSPLVLIALGTGIGAARSILQHRQRLMNKGLPVAPCKLFYGFRHKAKDCVFEEEFNEMENQGVVQVTYVASHDQKEFITPMDKFTDELKSFIGRDGEVYYCGLGGSVPSQVEGALTRVGVDCATLRAEGRLHEEYFTPDLDMENLLKQQNSLTADGANTLAGRMGKCEMFCFQCEQTFKGVGCYKQGVCGKTPRVAALQDLTVAAAKVLGYFAHNTRLLGGKVSPEINRYTLYALFSTLTNVNFDESRFVEIISKLKRLTDQARGEYEAACKQSNKIPQPPNCPMLPETLPDVEGLISMGKRVGVLSRFSDPSTQSAAGVTEMLMYGLKGIAAYTDHSLMNNKEDEAIYEFIHKALCFICGPKQFDLGEGLKLALEAGNINVKAMSLLYDSNKTLGVPSPTQVSIKPRPGKCILVSGHDLIILKALLEATEPLGINVYTHGEMLPSHGYGELRKHKNLAGNFGGAWMRQAVEFPHFPGPVLMTTNCLIEPHETYKARVFTAGAVGWKDCTHIGDNLQDIDFGPVIKAAQETKGFTDSDKEFSYADPVGQKRPAALTVGFGHEAILGAAPTIIEEIKKGNITRFFVVGGCDGYEGDRSYYTDLVAKLPKTCVVLTLGCGKFRVNHLDLGTIGDTGIPRILDMGQCNDAFGAVQVALALAEVLKCKVGDLPLSIVLSWFEQKAIAVLLSCLALGLKPVHVGPALPAFITPDVLQVLVKDFGVRPLGNVDEDLKLILAESKMA